jgi:phage gp29-like protein
MAKQGAKVGRTYIPINTNVTISNVVMKTQDIGNWKRAIDTAKSSTLPRRRLLIEMFEQLEIDGQVSTMMEKVRCQLTTTKPVWIPDEDNEDAVKAVNESVLNTLWFYQFLEHIADAEAYGFSLCEFVPEAGVFSKCELLPRVNCFPEFDWFNRHYTNSSPDTKDGINYKEDPRYKNNLIFIGKKKSYGKLMAAAQYVIYKRGGFGDWAQFAEIFGMPFRDAEYDPFDVESRKQLEENMKNWSGNGWMIRPKGTSLTLHDTNQAGKSEVYENFVRICDEQISKIFLGQTMTTDDGSSRSQSEVHAGEQNSLKVARNIRTEYILNEDLKPRLLAQGYPVTKGRFGYAELNKLPLDKLIDVVMKAARMVDVSPEYIYQTFGVERPKEGEVPVRISTPSFSPDNSEEETDPDKPNPNEDQKKKLSVNRNSHQINLNALYSHIHHLPHVLTLSAAERSDSIWEHLAKQMHEGKIRPGYIDPDLYVWTRDKLFAGVTKGYGDYTPETPDEDMIMHLQKNIQVFSGFKTYNQLKDAQSLLTEENGQVRSFIDFRNDILQLDSQYNVNWLNAEYNLAVTNAQMASRWIDIEKNQKILPMLTFRTSGGDNVCPVCSPFDGISKPVEDSFWDVNYPALHFGCVCDVEQSDSEVETDIGERDLPEVKPMFRNNVGKSGVVFPNSHPYFKVNKTERNIIHRFVKDQERDGE